MNNAIQGMIQRPDVSHKSSSFSSLDKLDRSLRTLRLRSLHAKTRSRTQATLTPTQGQQAAARPSCRDLDLERHTEATRQSVDTIITICRLICTPSREAAFAHLLTLQTRARSHTEQTILAACTDERGWRAADSQQVRMLHAFPISPLAATHTLLPASLRSGARPAAC